MDTVFTGSRIHGWNHTLHFCWAMAIAGALQVDRFRSTESHLLLMWFCTMASISVVALWAGAGPRIDEGPSGFGRNLSAVCGDGQCDGESAPEFLHRNQDSLDPCQREGRERHASFCGEDIRGRRSAGIGVHDDWPAALAHLRFTGRSARSHDLFPRSVQTDATARRTLI